MFTDTPSQTRRLRSSANSRLPRPPYQYVSNTVGVSSYAPAVPLQHQQLQNENARNYKNKSMANSMKDVWDTSAKRRQLLADSSRSEIATPSILSTNTTRNQNLIPPSSDIQLNYNALDKEYEKLKRKSSSFRSSPSFSPINNHQHLRRNSLLKSVSNSNDDTPPSTRTRRSARGRIARLQMQDEEDEETDSDYVEKGSQVEDGESSDDNDSSSDESENESEEADIQKRRINSIAIDTDSEYELQVQENENELENEFEQMNSSFSIISSIKNVLNIIITPIIFIFLLIKSFLRNLNFKKISITLLIIFTFLSFFLIVPFIYSSLLSIISFFKSHIQSPSSSSSDLKFNPIQSNPKDFNELKTRLFDLENQVLKLTDNTIKINQFQNLNSKSINNLNDLNLKHEKFINDFNNSIKTILNKINNLNESNIIIDENFNNKMNNINLKLKNLGEKINKNDDINFKKFNDISKEILNFENYLRKFEINNESKLNLKINNEFLKIEEKILNKIWDLLPNYVAITINSKNGKLEISNDFLKYLNDLKFKNDELINDKFNDFENSYDLKLKNLKSSLTITNNNNDYTWDDFLINNEEKIQNYFKSIVSSDKTTTIINKNQFLNILKNDINELKNEISEDLLTLYNKIDNETDEKLKNSLQLINENSNHHDNENHFINSGTELIINKLIEKSLIKHLNSFNKRINFASYKSSGSRIDLYLTSRTLSYYTHSSLPFKLFRSLLTKFGLIIDNNLPGPINVISDNDENYWCADKPNAQITIRLKDEIHLTDILIRHNYLYLLNDDKKDEAIINLIKSIPKKISIWVLIDPKKINNNDNFNFKNKFKNYNHPNSIPKNFIMIDLIQFSNDIGNGNDIENNKQIFKINESFKSLNLKIQYILFYVEENYGNSLYTCFDKIGIFGYRNINTNDFNDNDVEQINDDDNDEQPTYLIHDDDKTAFGDDIPLK